MPKHLIFLFLSLILLGSPLSAQQWKAAIKHTQKLIKQNPRLDAQLNQSLQRAAAVQKAFIKTKNYPVFLREYPLQQHHPMMAFSKGWLIAEHREWTAQRIVYEKVLRQLIKHQHLFPRYLDTLPIQTPDQLARLIPADAKYVFMGEYHENYLSQYLQKTVVEFARLHPEKQIFIFSEFATENTTSLPWWSFALKEYFALYDKARLPWVGLEENVPIQIEALSYEQEELLAPSMLLGMKARNAHWTQILKAYRQKYPDAVFFVHSGSAHTDYQEPYSVSASFSPQESFVMQFVSASNAKEYIKQHEKFHAITHGQYLRESVLVWKNKTLAHMTGFDVQVLLDE